jgi:hypothetical protein
VPVTSRAQRTTLLAAATALALAASGCSGSADDSTTTPPMLAAAVDAHTDAPLRAAAELPEGSQGVVEGDVTVEVSLDREVGDNAHVLLAVTRGTPFGVSAAELADLCESLGPCEEVDGATLVFENGSPESDPGIAYAWMERGDVTVWAYGYGPFIEQDPAQRSEEVAALAETLVGVVSDPGVGFTSAAAYVEGAQEICDGPWLDWYGQGNGSPEPEDSTDWC